MKPIPILISINLAFFAIWALVFALLMNRPEYLPLMTSLQGAVNILGAGIFLLDRRKHIAVAFLVGALLAGAATAGGYYVLHLYRDQIRLDEHVTT